MPLSSTSTLAQVQAAYDDNASYEEDGDAAKARAFITACRLLIRRLARSVEKSSGSIRQRVELELAQIREQQAAAQAWLAVHGGAKTPDGTTAGAGARYFSFEDFRV